MGERRKRKSMWDVEEETKVFPRVSENNSSHNFSSSQTSIRPKFGDQSGKPSLESNEEKSSVGPLNPACAQSRQSSPEGKEIGGGNKYYQNMSPGFDGIEQHKLLHHGHITEDSNLWEDKGNSNVIYNNRALESEHVSNAEFIGEKNTDGNIHQQDHGVAQGNVLDEMNGFSGQDMNQNGENGLLFSGPSSFFSNASATQSIENGRKSPNNTETEISNLQSSPSGVSHGQINPSENERVTEEVGNLTQPDNAKVDDPGNSKPKQETNPEADEGNNNNKVARLFKNSLIEFVKEILKPTWKEGRLSRDVHKTIVKKVVDKVTSTVQEDHIPKTQEKVDQYLLFSKPKIGKLVQAYVERSLRTDS